MCDDRSAASISGVPSVGLIGDRRSPSILRVPSWRDARPEPAREGNRSNWTTTAARTLTKEQDILDWGAAPDPGIFRGIALAFDDTPKKRCPDPSRGAGAPGRHRRAVDLAIPCQVASPQSLTLFRQTSESMPGSWLDYNCLLEEIAADGNSVNGSFTVTSNREATGGEKVVDAEDSRASTCRSEASTSSGAARPKRRSGRTSA